MAKKKQFKSFKEAREFVRSLGLKNYHEWTVYYKSGKRPDNIPANPYLVYKNSGWINWGDWLGTGNVANFNKEFRSFESAREYVRSLGLKSYGEWRTYRKSGKRPDNIPANPYLVYKNSGWINWGDWLGTGNVTNFNKEFRSFESAREYVRSLGLKSYGEWRTYCKSGKKPEDIQSNPHQAHKNSGWINWGDWLGSGNVANFNKEFKSFKDAREYVRSLGLKNYDEWRAYCKSGKKPEDIPACPRQTYKNGGWLGFGDWLGTGTIANQNKEFRSFESAREYVRSLGLKSYDEWKAYRKSSKRPDDIPSCPDRIYKNRGWLGFGDWFGTGTIANQNKEFRSFESSREYVRSLGLKSYDEWRTYCKSGKKPEDIPSCPYLVYKNSGWINWGDWLGDENLRKRKRWQIVLNHKTTTSIKSY